MASKIKKALKKIGKAALVAGAGYAAMKGLGGRKTDSGLSAGKKFLMSGAAGGARLPKAFSKANMRDIAGSGDVMPGMLSRNMGMTGRDSILGKRGINRFDDGNMYQGAKDGGRIGKKSGGKVRGCGIAKRGLGRAMKKGKR